MDNHDKAHYTIHALLVAALIGGSVGLYYKIKAIPVVTDWPDVALSPSVFGNNNWTIYASPNSGSLPKTIAAAVTAGGNKVNIQADMTAHEGIWVSPDDPEGHAVADYLGTQYHVKVNVGNFDDGEKVFGNKYQIGVGSLPDGDK